MSFKKRIVALEIEHTKLGYTTSSINVYGSNHSAACKCARLFCVGKSLHIDLLVVGRKSSLEFKGFIEELSSFRDSALVADIPFGFRS